MRTLTSFFRLTAVLVSSLLVLEQPIHTTAGYISHSLISRTTYFSTNALNAPVEWFRVIERKRHDQLLRDTIFKLKKSTPFKITFLATIAAISAYFDSSPIGIFLAGLPIFVGSDELELRSLDLRLTRSEYMSLSNKVLHQFKTHPNRTIRPLVLFELLDIPVHEKSHEDKSRVLKILNYLEADGLIMKVGTPRSNTYKLNAQKGSATISPSILNLPVKEQKAAILNVLRNSPKPLTSTMIRFLLGDDDDRGNWIHQRLKKMAGVSVHKTIFGTHAYFTYKSEIPSQTSLETEHSFINLSMQERQEKIIEVLLVNSVPVPFEKIASDVNCKGEDSEFLVFWLEQLTFRGLIQHKKMQGMHYYSIPLSDTYIPTEQKSDIAKRQINLTRTKSRFEWPDYFEYGDPTSVLPPLFDLALKHAGLSHKELLDTYASLVFEIGYNDIPAETHVEKVDAKRSSPMQAAVHLSSQLLVSMRPRDFDYKNIPYLSEFNLSELAPPLLSVYLSLLNSALWLKKGAEGLQTSEIGETQQAQLLEETFSISISRLGYESFGYWLRHVSFPYHPIAFFVHSNLQTTSFTITSNIMHAVFSWIKRTYPWIFQKKANTYRAGFPFAHLKVAA